MCALLLTQTCLTICGPMDCSPPDFSAHGIFRQECWSGVPFPILGDFPDLGIEPVFLVLTALAGRVFFNH